MYKGKDFLDIIYKFSYDNTKNNDQIIKNNIGYI